MRLKNFLIATAVAAGVVTFSSGSTYADHPGHYVITPNGNCHQVALGQTALSSTSGGYHQFHTHVHLGATESTVAPDNLGDGHAVVRVYRGLCPVPEA